VGAWYVRLVYGRVQKEGAGELKNIGVGSGVGVGKAKEFKGWASANKGTGVEY
jgi:hypothetical protein